MRNRYKKFTILTLAFIMSFCLVVMPTIYAAQDDYNKFCVEDVDCATYDPNACGDTETAVSAGSGDADGAAFPNLDPNAMATAIDKWVKKTSPSSPLKGLGKTIVATGKNSNVSPFLIISIARKESTLGTAQVFNVTSLNNAFGRTATSSQPHAANGKYLWYKWSSFKASVDYKAPENNRPSGDMGAYIRKQYGDQVDKGSFVEFFLEYAPPFENETAVYTREVKSWIDELVALTKNPGAAPAADEEDSIEEDAPAGGASCTCDASSGSSSSVLSKNLKPLADENGGTTAISVSSINGNVAGNSAGDKQLPTRSSYKIYTAYATLKAIEDGNITWGTKVWGGNSVEKTMEEMIVESNNNAAEALRTNDKIGTASQVTKLLQEKVGLSDKTVMGTASWKSPTGTNTKSTANDFVKFLILLHKKKLPGVSKDSSYDKLISYMKRATTDGGSARSGIAAGVGGGVEVADKPGWGPSPAPAANDVGIVYRKNVYVVAILTDKPSDWAGVAKIAKGVDKLMRSEGETGAEEDGQTITNDSPGTDECGGSVGGGDLIATVKAYAHPDYHAPQYLARMPAYAKAVKKAVKEGNYVGGSVGGVPGIDCGGFVTRLLLDSGFEPGYNYEGKSSKGAGNTYGGQEPWLVKNWKKINPKSTKDLEPGDVAINHDHTYIYVGKIPGFNSLIASASYSERGNGRAPMAGKEAPAAANFNWYRKK